MYCSDSPRVNLGNDVTFADMLPLHELWTQYAARLHGTSNTHSFLERVQKMDLHGALLRGSCHVAALTLCLSRGFSVAIEMP